MQRVFKMLCPSQSQTSERANIAFHDQDAETLKFPLLSRALPQADLTSHWAAQAPSTEGRQQRDKGMQHHLGKSSVRYYPLQMAPGIYLVGSRVSNDRQHF